MYAIFIGPPGSGKGTQCQRLSQELSIPSVSTGSILRDAKKRGDLRITSEVGNRIDSGDFAPDHLVVDLVRERLEAPEFARGAMLDGFPRNLSQARALDSILEGSSNPSIAIHLSVPRSHLLERIKSRSAIEGRVDDASSSVLKRMEIYESDTHPVLGYYQARRALWQVDGLMLPDELCSLVGKILSVALECSAR